MARVSGKRALVTGAGSGIGRSVALLLAAEGAAVAVTDIDAESAQRTASDILDAGGTAAAWQQDVSDETRWTEVADALQESYGGWDILVNNAGVSVGGPVFEVSTADWRRSIAINLDSVFFGTRLAIQRMAATGGSVINISSVAGIIGVQGLSPYSAAKGGVRLFSKSAALDAGAAGLAVRVNSVHPGIIDTPIWGPEEAIGEFPGRAALFELVKGQIPLGHPGVVDDIAYAVLYLASDESKFVTGTELIIDGGQTAA